MPVLPQGHVVLVPNPQACWTLVEGNPLVEGKARWRGEPQDAHPLGGSWYMKNEEMPNQVMKTMGSQYVDVDE